MLPKEDSKSSMDMPVRGGAFDDQSSPFGLGQTEGVNAGLGEAEWVVEKQRTAYDEQFLQLNPIAGKITGASAKAELVKSKLPNSVLAKVWRLSDCDKDGMLDIDEWALSNYLIKLKLDGFELPNTVSLNLTIYQNDVLFYMLIATRSSCSAIKKKIVSEFELQQHRIKSNTSSHQFHIFNFLLRALFYLKKRERNKYQQSYFIFTAN